MANRRGAVWYGHQRVGGVREDEDRNLLFAYDDDWLSEGEFPVSIQLPLSNGDQEMDASAFFYGLLPEGNVRQRICRRLGIHFSDDTGLLFMLGGDCAGALSVLPAGMSPEDETSPPRDLTENELNRMVRSLGEDTSMLSGEEQRFSLAGAQEKQPVIHDSDVYSLPDHVNPSSHILKFETVPWVCFAEYAANAVARQFSLPAVATEFLHIGSAGELVPYLRIERFDRERDGAGRLFRSHQEDVLQASGQPAMLKYQRDGGPSIKDVAELLREYIVRPAEALSYLRDWQILNLLIGNWDGHTKNLAIVYPPGRFGPELAPFYDLISIEFLNAIRPGSWSRDLALAVGTHYSPERVTRSEWDLMAHDMGIPSKRLLDRLEDMANRLPEVVEQVVHTFTLSYGDKAVYGRLYDLVRKRCRWTLNSTFKAYQGS